MHRQSNTNINWNAKKYSQKSRLEWIRRNSTNLAKLIPSKSRNFIEDCQPTKNLLGSLAHPFGRSLAHLFFFGSLAHPFNGSLAHHFHLFFLWPSLKKSYDSLYRQRRESDKAFILDEGFVFSQGLVWLGSSSVLIITSDSEIGIDWFKKIWKANSMMKNFVFHKLSLIPTFTLSKMGLKMLSQT